MTISGQSTTQLKSVLIVEDDREIRELIQEALEMEGFATLTAAHGSEALDTLNRNPKPAVIVLDLMMPKMNGWEFLKFKKGDARWSAIPVVLLTAVGDGYFDPQLAEEVIKKPIELDILLRAVRKHCNV